MWTYKVSSGTLYDPAGKIVGTGYSGHGAGVNNPDLEDEPDIGPIPRGEYTMTPFFNDPEKGPIVTRLIPSPDTVDFGRFGFMMHGDNSEGNHSASLGCIIMPHDVRLAVSQSGDTGLVVI